jgi:uncharacterized protein YjiS (DUF1127 family)
MTQAILTAHSYSTRAVELIIDALKSINEKRIERKAIRETEKALSKLSDYDLNDIGIGRGDIYHIARAKSTIENVKVNQNLQGWV